MSGLGRAFAEAQSRWDNASPPEAPADDNLAAELDAIIATCEEMFGRAQRALISGDLEAARDLLIEAAGDLAENVTIAWGRTE